ncbi:MAG: hypothetical protein JJ952_19470, partial [Pseudomonadales bacterium]|nr:hypothetical protein [Pseudomonadales bacterium]
VVGDATSGNITADEVDVVGQDLSLVTGGTINDDDDTGAAIATTGTLTLDAGSTIGDSGGAAGLDIDVGALTVTGSGGDVTVTDAGSTDTTYSVTAGGGGAIDITQGGTSDLLAAGISSTSTVDLTSGGSILQSSGTISGTTLTLMAGGADGDIGTNTTALSIDVTTVGATAAGTGEINLSEANTVDVSGLTTTNAAIQLAAGTSITSSGTIGSGGGAITLTADDGITLGGDVTAAGG